MRRLNRCTIVILIASFLLNIVCMDAMLPGIQVKAAPVATLSSSPVGKRTEIVELTVSDEPQPENGKNNLLDGELGTRWSAQGSTWLIADLGSEKKVTTIGIAFYLGDQRMQSMDMELSKDGKDWVRVFSGLSTGLTTDLEYYTFTETPARYVKISFNGNTGGDWNSPTELQIYATDGTGIADSSSNTAGQTQIIQAGPVDKPIGKAVTIQSVTVSDTPEPENSADNVKDGNLDTRWSAQGNQWLKADLGFVQSISCVGMAFWKGDERSQLFDIEISADGTNWTKVFSGRASGTTSGMQYWAFPSTQGRYVRINCYGTTAGDWNSINELQIFSGQVIMEGNEFSGAAGTVIVPAKNKELGLLSVLGIIDGYLDGSADEEARVTRAQLAVIITKMLKLEDALDESDNEQRFRDVPKNHFAYTSIQLATRLRIINGINDYEFAPEQPVTYEQAVKILVSALGYDILAQNKGGYPTGYLIMASDLGITRKASGTIGENVKLGQLARMVYNALKTDLFEQVGFGDNVTLTAVKGKNLLNSKHDIYEFKGIVTANSMTSLTSDSNLDDDEVEFNNKYIYKTGFTNISDYLGHNMVVYAKEDKNQDEDTVIYAYDETNVTIVKAEDIEEVDSSNFSYWVDKDEDDKPESISLESDLKVIYNGKFTFAAVTTVLAPKAGIVKLLDNDNNGKCDVAIVEEYKNFVVKDKSTVTYSVRDLYTDDIVVLDERKDEPKIAIFRDGMPASFKDIRQWDVLAVYADVKNTMITVKIVRNSFAGEIDEIEEDKVIINGREYSIAQSYLDALNGGSSNAVSLELNQKCTFYLDINGDIAAIDNKEATTGEYGFLVNMAYKSTASEIVIARIYTGSGQLVDYELANKIRFNGSTINSEKIMTYSYIYDSTNKKAHRQLITYSLNGEGKIREVNTAEYLDDSKINNESILETYISNNVFRTYARSTLDYNGWEGGLQVGGIDDNNNNRRKAKFYIGNSVKVFTVPKSDEYINDAENYSIGGRGVFQDNKDYDVQVYDFDAMMQPKAIVRYSDPGENTWIDPGSSVKIFAYYNEAVTKDGERVYSVYYYDNGRKESRLTSPSRTSVQGAIEGLKLGDGFQFATNSKGEITEIVTLFDVNTALNVNRYGGIFDGYNSNRYIVKGDIVKYDGEYLKIKLGSENTSSKEIYRFNANSVYIVNMKKETVKAGTKDDLAAGLQVIIRTSYGRVREIFIYDKE